MKKIETIWHHLLFSAIEKGEFKYTQKSLANFFGYSLSTVNLAVKIVASVGAVNIKGKFFILSDVKKLLYFWATHRNLEKGIVYETFMDVGVSEIEGLMPGGIIFAGYSAATRILNDPPADYSKVYIYAYEENIDEIKKRFPRSTGQPSNLIVLSPYGKQKDYGEITTVAQTFVDIWNMGDWYSKDFIFELERKIDELLS